MSKKIQNKITWEQILLVGSGLLAVSLVAIYIYLVSLSVVHVVMRKEVSHEINQLHTEIAMLEAEYMKAQHVLARDLAYQNGFVDTPDKIFLDRTNASVVVRNDQ